MIFLFLNLISVDNIRIVHGEYPNQGHVQIKLNDEWGTICDQDWDDQDALVVCRQLGYRGSIRAVSGDDGSAYFSQGTGSIHITKVQCNGQEHDILSCRHSTLPQCDHDKDAGVVCLDDNYPMGLASSFITTRPPTKPKQNGSSTNWSDIFVSIIFPAAILFAIYLIYRRLYTGQTPPPTPNRARSCQRNSCRAEQYRVVPAPYGTMSDPHAPTDPDAPPPYEQVISEHIKESQPIVTVAQDIFIPTTPDDDGSAPYNPNYTDAEEDEVRSSSV